MIQGYGVTAEFDGQTLTLTATNAASRGALLGSKTLAKVADKAADHYEKVAAEQGQQIAPVARLSVDGDSVAIPTGSIRNVEFKDASMLVNGNLTVHTLDGKKYQAHFRKKQSPDFVGLARSLGAQV